MGEAKSIKSVCGGRYLCRDSSPRLAWSENLQVCGDDELEDWAGARTSQCNPYRRECLLLVTRRITCNYSERMSVIFLVHLGIGWRHMPYLEVLPADHAVPVGIHTTKQSSHVRRCLSLTEKKRTATQSVGISGKIRRVEGAREEICAELSENAHAKNKQDT